MNHTQARDEMFDLLRVQWGASAPGVVSNAYTPALYWPGVEVGEPPGDKGWGRVSLLNASGRQSSLADASGSRRFERRGVVIVQCFGPMASGKGYDIAEGLAMVALAAFEGKRSVGGVWFRECRLNEVGPQNGWFAVNAIAEFIYDEVK